MEEFIEKKKKSSTSSYNIKRMFKGMVGSDMNEILERQRLQAAFVKNLTPAERIRFKEELREQKYQEYLDKEGVNASEIIANK